MERNFTTGNVFKNIIIFALPYLLSYLLQTLYGMADLYIIGLFGEVADSSSVSIGSQVMHMITVIIVGLAMGTTVSIAQSIGRNNKKDASNYIGNTTILFMIVSVILTIILLLLVKPITYIMKTPIDAVNGTINYLIVCFIGIPFITAYNILSSIFRGMGDSKSPMYFILIACIANIGLDFLFMGIFNLGPVGAALGTTISQAISVIISLIIISKRKSLSLSKESFKPSKEIMTNILKIGAPVAFQDGLIQISFIIITIIANNRGLNDSAAVGIVEKIMSFLFLVPSTMLSTISALGAQNIGANKPKRAIETLKYGILISVIFGITISIIIQFIAEPVISLFTDTSKENGAEVVTLGGQYIKGYIWDSIFAGVHFCFSGYFCAINKSKLSFLHNIIAIVIMRIPGVYITSKLFTTTLFPMGLATASGSLISIIICIIAFSVLMKKQKQ